MASANVQKLLKAAYPDVKEETLEYAHAAALLQTGLVALANLGAFAAPPAHTAATFALEVEEMIIKRLDRREKIEFTDMPAAEFAQQVRARYKKDKQNASYLRLDMDTFQSRSVD